MSLLYELDKGDDYLTFNDKGELSISTYSYQIDSCGNLELNKEETFKLFKIMEAYYGQT